MVPHEIKTEAGAKLDEKLKHLTQISGVSMGVEKRAIRLRVSDINSDDLVAATSAQLQDVDVIPARSIGDVQSVNGGGIAVVDQTVGRWGWREEGEFSGDRRSYSSHSEEDDLIIRTRHLFFNS